MPNPEGEEFEGELLDDKGEVRGQSTVPDQSTFKSQEEVDRLDRLWHAAKDEVLNACASSTQMDSEGYSYSVTRTEAGRSQQAVPMDGPLSRFRFRLNCCTHKFPPQQWQLLKAMWPNGEMKDGELMERIWGDDDCREAALKTAISRVNELLAEAEYSRYIHRKGGIVFWTNGSNETVTRL